MSEDAASPYVDIARLGRGGMREVFLSLQRDLIAREGLVVVKRVDPWLAEEPDFVEHYVVEAETAMRLDHPGVVRMKKVGRDDAGHYVAMEYVDGQSLLALLRRAAATNAIPLAMHLRVLADALEPLHYAHELDVLHRDATARNVFIDYEGRVRLADFCIGRSNESRQTAADVLRTQKVPYMSPEEARGDELDRRSDVFAFGVMIWKAATGQRLWRGLTGMQTLYRLHKGDIPSPRTVDPNVPERLEAICMRALACDRADRYATAKELRDDLETFLREAGEPVTARDVGQRVSDLFTEARAKNDRVIDAQIAAVKANPSAPPEVKDLRLDAGDTAETTPENTDDSRFWATGMLAPSPSIAPRAIEPARSVRPPARAAAAESPVAGSLPQWAIYAVGILVLAIAAMLLLRR
jgi:serine/threonine protein kinase